MTVVTEDGVEAARAGAGRMSDGGVTEVARVDIERVTGGPGGAVGCC